MKPSLTALVLLALSTACHSMESNLSNARPAPFRARPDSTAMGVLAGPFNGQIHDAATGDPVAGALVYATWTYQESQFQGQPNGFQEAVASTDANGRYRIASPARQRSGKLTDFHIVVYKRGYVGYRSDRRFSDLGPRFDFAQRNNKITMERWHSDLSHAQHLRYLGGGAAITALSSWEVDRAAAELSGTQTSVAQAPSDLLASLADNRLIAAQLLGGQEIKAITGFDGSFESGPLNDEPSTNSYSSQHFKALGQPEVFDVALRLWRLPSSAAAIRFTELTDSLPGISERTDVGDKSILAIEGDIQGYAFLDSQRGLVALLTCGKGQCREVDQLVELAQKVYENIEAVAPAASARP